MPASKPEIDAVIIGGGPAGLSAALALGRACRRVVVFEHGTPRNIAATHIQNFVTRDGTPPSEFREIARKDLRKYPNVEIVEERVVAIDSVNESFRVEFGAGSLLARRVILGTGMVDQMLDIPGFHEAWGHSIFQCPYCHGWEVRDKLWAYLALDLESLEHGFPAMLKGWTNDVLVLTLSGFEIPQSLQDTLKKQGVSLESRALKSLNTQGQHLTHLVLEDDEHIECEVLFAHPPQSQVELVQKLGLDVDPAGYIIADPMTRKTSIPGVYAAGDLTTRAQGAIFAAASGTQAGAMCNWDLAMQG